MSNEYSIPVRRSVYFLRMSGMENVFDLLIYEHISSLNSRRNSRGQPKKEISKKRDEQAFYNESCLKLDFLKRDFFD